MRRNKPFITVFRQIDLKDATITIKDGGAGSAQNSLEIKIGEGNLAWTEKRNINYIKDRGNLDDVTEGDQEPMDVNFEFVWEYLKGASGSGAAPTIKEALTKTGNASSWVSSDTDTCRPYAVDLEIAYIPTGCPASDQETITLPDFRHDELAHDLRGAQVACTGRCNATTATSVRASQS